MGKSLKKLLNEKHVPPEKRCRIPLLENTRRYLMGTPNGEAQTRPGLMSGEGFIRGA